MMTPILEKTFTEPNIVPRVAEYLDESDKSVCRTCNRDNKMANEEAVCTTPHPDLIDYTYTDTFTRPNVDGNCLAGDYWYQYEGCCYKVQPDSLMMAVQANNMAHVQLLVQIPGVVSKCTNYGDVVHDAATAEMRNLLVQVGANVCYKPPASLEPYTERYPSVFSHSYKTRCPRQNGCTENLWYQHLHCCYKIKEDALRKAVSHNDVAGMQALAQVQGIQQLVYSGLCQIAKSSDMLVTLRDVFEVDIAAEMVDAVHVVTRAYYDPNSFERGTALMYHFLNTGVDINAKGKSVNFGIDVQYGTLLHVMVKVINATNVHVLDDLLARGIDPTIKNRSKLTAMQLAEKNRNYYPYAFDAYRARGL
jgi:hypothetical protein